MPATTEEVRGYTLNLPGRRPPWGDVENQLFKDVIQYLPDEGSYLTELHHHSNLYAPDDDTAGGVPRIAVGEDTIVFNEQGDDIDVRIEGAGVENLFRTDAENDRIGIGIAAPDTRLHILGASAGAVAAPADTLLTIEDDTNAYIAFLLPSGTGNAGLLIGDVADNDAARFYYNHPNDRWHMWGRGTEILRYDPTSGCTMTNAAGIANARGLLDLDQADNTLAMPVLYLEQTDVDEAFMEFNGTVGAIGVSNICTDNANGSHAAGNCSGPRENWQHYAMLRCTVAGVGDRWIPLYIGS